MLQEASAPKTFCLKAARSRDDRFEVVRLIVSEWPSKATDATANLFSRRAIEDAQSRFPELEYAIETFCSKAAPDDQFEALRPRSSEWLSESFDTTANLRSYFTRDEIQSRFSDYHAIANHLNMAFSVSAPSTEPRFVQVCQRSLCEQSWLEKLDQLTTKPRPRFEILGQPTEWGLRIIAAPVISQEEPSEEELINSWDKYLAEHWGELAAKYTGEYVAIWNNRVYDHDKDLAALAKRVYAALGYRPVFMPYIGKNKTIAEFISPT